MFTTFYFFVSVAEIGRDPIDNFLQLDFNIKLVCRDVCYIFNLTEYNYVV